MITLDNNTMPTQPTLYIGSDHAGFALKEAIKQYLDRKKVQYEDLGNHQYVRSDDYPDSAYAVAAKVAKANARGIVVCHNGVGVCIAANKVNGVRAVNAPSVAIAKESRTDNDTNVLCLGGEYISSSLAKRIIAAWLETPFSRAERHHRRVNKIKKIESKR